MRGAVVSVSLYRLADIDGGWQGSVSPRRPVREQRRRLRRQELAGRRPGHRDGRAGRQVQRRQGLQAADVGLCPGHGRGDEQAARGGGAQGDGEAGTEEHADCEWLAAAGARGGLILFKRGGAEGLCPWLVSDVEEFRQVTCAYNCHRKAT